MEEVSVGSNHDGDRVKRHSEETFYRVEGVFGGWGWVLHICPSCHEKYTRHLFSLKKRGKVY